MTKSIIGYIFNSKNNRNIKAHISIQTYGLQTRQLKWNHSFHSPTLRKKMRHKLVQVPLRRINYQMQKEHVEIPKNQNWCGGTEK